MKVLKTQKTINYRYDLKDPIEQRELWLKYSG